MRRYRKENIIILLLWSLWICCSCNQDSSQKNAETKTSDKLSMAGKETKQSAAQTDPANHVNSIQVKRKSIADEIILFTPNGYEVLDTAVGDLNLDGLDDLILVLKSTVEDSLSDLGEYPLRPLLILIRGKDNQLQVAKRNDHTVYCADCGGVWGDPYDGIAIKNGYFS